VSCAWPGNCSAGGDYFDRSGNQQAFVVSEDHGTWGTAVEIPGTGAHNHRYAQIEAMSCASPGNCGAGGDYTDSSGRERAFVVSEVHGTWRTAIVVSGTAVGSG
jgi:hypothetical protein